MEDWEGIFKFMKTTKINFNYIFPFNSNPYHFTHFITYLPYSFQSLLRL